MNNIRFLTALTSCVLLSVLEMRAESLLTFPKGDFSCTIKVSFHTNSYPVAEPGKPIDPAIPSLPQKAEVSKISNLLYVEISKTNNQFTRAWRPGTLNLTIFKDSKDSKVNSTRTPQKFPAVFFLESDPFWFSWLNRDDFKEEVEYEGVKCRRYQQNVVIPSYGPFPDGISTYQMWIDAKTLVPVAFDDGEVRYDLKFGGPPAVMPSMPEDVQKEIKRYQELLAAPKRRQAPGA